MKMQENAEYCAGQGFSVVFTSETLGFRTWQCKSCAFEFSQPLTDPEPPVIPQYHPKPIPIYFSATGEQKARLAARISQSPLLAWFNQIVQQFRDLTYEDSSPVFASVQDGPTEQIDQQHLPCVSVTTSTGTVLVALVFVARLTRHQWKYPTSQSLDAATLQYRIQDATWKHWGRRGIPGSMHRPDGISYHLLEYTFYRHGDPFEKREGEKEE